jgi:hypothetical protein
MNKTLLGKLNLIQNNLNAPKNLYNQFGNFKYRNLEGIFEGLKPILVDMEQTIVTVSDEMVCLEGRYYIKATASITDETDTIEVTAFAREPEGKKGMDDSQLTGSTSSYARKYAMNGLFAIDDTQDADTMDNRPDSAHHNGAPLIKGKVTQDQSILMERLSRDNNTLPQDKERLKELAKNKYNITVVEAKIMIEDIKEGKRKNTKATKNKITVLTKKLTELDKKDTIEWLEGHDWKNGACEKVELKLKEK